MGLLLEYNIVTRHILRDGNIELHPLDHVLPECYGVRSSGQEPQHPCCTELEADVPSSRVFQYKLNCSTSAQDSPDVDKVQRSVAFDQHMVAEEQTAGVSSSGGYPSKTTGHDRVSDIP